MGGVGWEGWGGEEGSGVGIDDDICTWSLVMCSVTEAL